MNELFSSEIIKFIAQGDFYFDIKGAKILMKNMFSEIEKGYKVSKYEDELSERLSDKIILHEMKNSYLIRLKDVPTDEDAGFIQYLEWKEEGKVNLRLEIEHDTSSWMCTWTLIRYYNKVVNKVKTEGQYRKVVYQGYKIPDVMFNNMVDLVLMEESYESIKNRIEHI